MRPRAVARSYSTSGRRYPPGIGSAQGRGGLRDEGLALPLGVALGHRLMSALDPLLTFRATAVSKCRRLTERDELTVNNSLTGYSATARHNAPAASEPLELGRLR